MTMPGIAPDLESTLLAASGFDVPWQQEAAQAVQSVPLPPRWRQLNWPSEQAWVAAGSPEQDYSAYLQAQAATAQSLVAGASAAPATDVLESPPSPVQAGAGVPGTITPSSGASGLTAPPISAGAEAATVSAPHMSGGGGLLDKIGGLAGDVVNTVKDLPATALPGGAGAGISLLNSAIGRDATVGGAAQTAYDAYNTDIPVYSDFARNTLAPAAGKAVGTVNQAVNPAAPVLDIAKSQFGTPNAYDIGNEVGEALTPVTAGDVALSVFIPQTADWADAWRLAKEAGFVTDDTSRVVSNITRGQLDNLLAKVGKSTEDLPELPIGAAQKLVSGTAVDEGTEGARILAGPGVGRPLPEGATYNPGFGGGADLGDEASRAAPQGGVGPEPAASSAEPRVGAQEGAQQAGAATAVGEAPAEGLAGNIRLDKFPEDTRDIIKQWADANPDVVQTARRGTRSDEQVLADAEELVNNLGGDFAKMQRNWKPGQAWNAEEITAIRGALADSTRKVIDAAGAARAIDSTANQVKLAEAILEQQRVQQIVTGVTAEAGRSLRAFRQQAADALANGDVGQMQEILKRALGGKAATPERIAELADGIKALDLNNPIAVNRFLRDVNKPGFWDYALEYWYNSVLSGPWTHARNLIGNTARTVYEPIRRGGAAAVEGPLARIQGRAPERFWQEVPASVAGAFHGLPEGVKGAIDTLRYGFNPQDAGRVELRRQAFGGKLGRVIRFPSTALEAGDALFYSINYRMSLWGNAVRQARTEGLVGDALENRIAQLISEPSAGLVKQSAANADDLLFRGPSNLANTISHAKNQYPVLNFLLPFVKTPQNLLKFGFKNSPLGLLDYGMYQRILAKDPGAADEIAQTLLGSGVAAGLAALVATGQIDITAGLPVNASARDRFYREGKLPFSVKLPGVGWVQYNQIPGLDTTLTSLAAVVDGVRNGQSVDDIAYQTAATIGQSLLDRSYLSGLSDFLDAVSDPAGAAERWGTRQLTSAVPFSSALRQTANAIDPVVRKPASLGQQFAANIPGLSQNVPERLTAFGEPAERGFPSPIAISPDRQTAVDTELGRIGVEVGFVGKSIGGQSLNTEAQQLYQQAVGQQTYEKLQKLFQLDAYKNLSDAEKQDAIEKVVSRVRSDVRSPVTKMTSSDIWGTLSEPLKQQLIVAAFNNDGDEIKRLMADYRTGSPR